MVPLSTAPAWASSSFLLCWLWVGTETAGLLGNHRENVEGEICACSIWTLELCLRRDSEAGSRSWYPWRRQLFSGLFKSRCANVRCDRENMIQHIGLVLENNDTCVLSFTFRTYLWDIVAIFPSCSKLFLYHRQKWEFNQTQRVICLYSMECFPYLMIIQKEKSQSLVNISSTGKFTIPYGSPFFNLIFIF